MNRLMRALFLIFAALVGTLAAAFVGSVIEASHTITILMMVAFAIMALRFIESTVIID